MVTQTQKQYYTTLVKTYWLVQLARVLYAVVSPPSEKCTKQVEQTSPAPSEKNTNLPFIEKHGMYINNPERL